MANSLKISDLMHKQLRKSFKNIETIKGLWINSCNISASSLDSLQNVAEQYHCISRVVQSQQTNLMLVKRFPGIHERLAYKLIQEMELLVGKLQINCEELQTMQTKVHQQFVNSMAIYKKNSLHFPIDDITEGTPTWPSIADMLEWLQDLDTLFQYLYENQSQILTSIDYNNEDLMQNLPTKWKRGNVETRESLENVLAHVSFFMADG